MANYASLLATIANNITDNNSGAITGPVLKSVLDSMVGSLGTGYQFMGVATTSTNPGTPDQKVYYLAGPGTYTNFNNLVVADGEIAILKYDSAWSKVTTPIASADEVSQLGLKVIDIASRAYTPSGYHRVEWLGSNSLAFINTGVAGRLGLTIKAELYYDTFVTYGAFYGNYTQDSAAGYRTIFGTSAGRLIVATNSTFNATGVANVVTAKTWFNLLAQADGKIYVNGNLIEQVTPLDGGVTDNICLFNRSLTNLPAQTRNIGERVKSFSIKENGKYILYLVPMVRDSDNVLGMFDLCSNTFLTNVGTGSFYSGEIIPEVTEVSDDVEALNAELHPQSADGVLSTSENLYIPIYGDFKAGDVVYVSVVGDSSVSIAYAFSLFQDDTTNVAYVPLGANKQKVTLPADSSVVRLYLYRGAVITGGNLTFTLFKDIAYTLDSVDTLKQQLNEVQQETTDLRTDVGEKSDANVATSQDFTTSGHAVVANSSSQSFGNTTSSTANSVTGYIDIERFAGKVLHFLRLTYTAASTNYGLVFYSEASVSSAISGVLGIVNAAENGWQMDTVEIPANAKYVRFTCRTTDIPNWQAFVEEEGEYISGLGKRVQDLEEQIEQAGGTLKELHPKVEIGRLSNTGTMTEMLASIGSTNVTYIDKTYWRTGNYLAMGGIGELSLKSSINVYACIFYFDENFAWVASGNPSTTEVTNLQFFQLSANVDYIINKNNIPEGAKYIKFCFRSSASASNLSPLDKFVFSVRGNFKDVPIVKNVRSADTYEYGAYQTVAAIVNVTDTDCCDEMTTAVQDTENLKFDYGVLALPNQYTNVGKPTRLIIYCHGAGANYNLQSTRFHSSIDPRLWLSEGYAVLDMDCDPYTDNNVHGYVPGALQSIESAYQWIIEHYNIYTDGILLAGKSMGGGMTFCVMRSSIIPVIASCAIVPVCNYVWWWTYMNATRRAFCAEKLGFIGTAPTWTSNSPMSSEEWQYLMDNYDKFTTYNPFNRLLSNPPSKEEMFMGTNLQASATTPTQAETDLWANRVAKVPCPVKFFIGQDDTTVPPLRNGKFLFDALKRGSEIVEYRQFPTGGHKIEQPDNGGFGQDIINSYGETITNAPVVFAEILQFWRRFEQSS